MNTTVNPAVDAIVITQPQHARRRDKPKVSARVRRIPGWGADLPREKRPGVPREADLSPADNGAHWDQPEQQISDVKIFHSVERPGVTPVFGTTLPPRALSGRIRSQAYRLGEGQRRRWLMLLAADRVDVVESAILGLIFEPRYYAHQSRKIRPAVVALGAVGLLGATLYWMRRIEAWQSERA